jgi:hypothetical protein
MFRDLEAPLEGTRLLVARIVLTAWGIAFAGTVVFLGETLVLYFAPGMPLGPCAPMGLCAALFALLCTGVPWVPAYLQYRKTRLQPAAVTTDSPTLGKERI